MSEISKAQPRPPFSPMEWFLLAALVAVLALRLVAIEADPPGGIVSQSGAFLSDEGYYLKAATLRHSFGTWRQENDINWYPITPLYAVLTVAMGHLFQPLLVPARYASVLCSVAGIGVFYAICRHSRTRAESLLCCLLAAAAFDNFTFSRLAFCEPMGTMFGLLALYFWVAWRGRWGWAAASCACAAAAQLTKFNLLYTPITIGLLWLGEAALAWQAGRRRQALRLAAILSATACVGFAATVYALSGPGEALHIQRSTGEVAGISTLSDVLAHEAKLFWLYPRAAWRRALVVGAALGVVWYAVAGRRARARDGSEGASARPLVAMGLWCGVGMAFLGLFEYQVPRWLYFTVYPFAYLAVSALARAAPQRQRGVVLGLLLAGHLLSQALAVARYVARPPGTSLVDMARDVAQRLSSGGAPTVLAGNLSHLVAIFSRRIRPVTGAQLDAEAMRVRMRYWRPGYLIAYQRERQMLARECSDLFAAFHPVASYTVISNYYDGCDIVLFRIEYRADASPRTERSNER